MNIDSERLYTADEVAAMLRLSKMTVYRQIERGDLSAHRIGRSFRVPGSAIQLMLDDTRTTRFDPGEYVVTVSTPVPAHTIAGDVLDADR